MTKNFLCAAEAMTKERRKRQSRSKALVFLASIVVFCTTYALILPAITISAEKKLICSEELLSGHVHNAQCRDEEGRLICGYADFVLHSHDAACFDDEGNLICQLAEVHAHEHGADCPSVTAAEPEVNAAALSFETDPEGQAQTEDDPAEAYGSEPADNGETQPPQGDYGIAYGTQDASPCALIPHTHTEECFTEGVLTCGKVQLLQHQHTEDCFESTAPTEPPLHPEEEQQPEEEPKPDEDNSGTRTLSVQGEDYSVSVAFDGSAALPENVELSVTEILPDSEEYASYYQQTEQQLPEDQGLFFCRFFDVTFLSDGVKVEPQSSVDVQISYKEPVPQGESLSYNAIHFAEDGIEVIPAEVQETEDGEDAIVFSQDSFSVVGTAVSALNLNNGSYIFYKDGYALGVNNSGLRAFQITEDENGYVKPNESYVDISRITWEYENGYLKNTYTGQYLNLKLETEGGATVGNTPQKIDARIINNAVRFSYDTGVRDQNNQYANITYYLGIDSSSTYGATFTSSVKFAGGDYFLAAKVATVDDTVIKPGALEVKDEIREKGCITPQLNTELPGGGKLEYTWYRSKDDGQNWDEVTRTKITGDSYNVADDGSWLNVALDKGADSLYKIQVKSIDGIQVVDTIESQPFHVPYYDSLQNGDFEAPKISTNVSDPQHYQPLLPNGTAGMVWKTTAGDGEIEFVSTASAAFKEYSTNWHNCESPAKGDQYVELNAGMPGALYQDVLTVPGSTMYWRLAHRGRGVGKANISDLANTKDTMYVVIMSTVLAEQYNITTQDAVEKVLRSPGSYPGVSIATISDTSKQWVYHSGEYTVPDAQYLTRYFFVAGETAYDTYGSSGDNLKGTIGNHLDDVHFSTELPPPTEGKANLTVEKTIVGLDETEAREALEQLTFTINNRQVSGREFKNFTANGDKSFTASYQIQLDLGSSSYIDVGVAEDLGSRTQVGYDCTTTMSVNGVAQDESSTTVRIYDKDTATAAFTNIYVQQSIPIEIRKVDEDGRALTGAEFRLEQLVGRRWVTVAEQITVDASGKATINDLSFNTLYRLTETTAPRGYHALNTAIHFQLWQDKDLIPFDANGNQLAEWPELVSVLTDGTVGFQITNQTGMILPETGGSGVNGLYMAGLSLLATAAVLLCGNKGKRMKGGSAQRSL